MKDTPSRARELSLARLKLSGLDQKDLAALRFEPLTAAQTAKLSPSFSHVPAMRIPYFTIDGKPHPHKFYRLRYLDAPASFAGQTKKQKRYTQPPGSWVFAYFPPNGRWRSIIADPTQALLITEGEIKAATATKLGFATIGLGGVYSWRSANLGIPFLPELEAIVWAKRQVILAFDSDACTNPMITAALRQLGEKLIARGADVFVLSLPDVYDDGRKTGLDDFLVEHGPDELDTLITEAEEVILCKELWKFNEEVLYIRDPGIVIVQKNAQRMTPAAFKDHAFANRRYTERYLTADGTPKLREVALPKYWLEWPHRFEVGKIDYAPGEARIYHGTYNAWPGWKVQPIKGNVERWTWLLNRLFGKARDLSGEMELRRWFEAWCAYPLQYPGTKMFTAALLWGRAHGSGKSKIFNSLGEIYGANYGLVNTTQLDGPFNSWAYEKQLILADDLDSVSRQERNHRGGVLRTMISQETIRINQKYIPDFVIRDCVNYGITSNEPDSITIDDNDRRMFVHEVLCGRMTEEEAVEYDLWSSSESGAAALFHHLLNLDVSWFNPYAPALETRAKRAMIGDSKGDVAQWLDRLKHDPDGVLRVGQVALKKDLYTNSELRALIDPSGQLKLTANLLGRELRRNGFLHCAGELVLKVPGRAADRYYAVRRPELWLEAKPAACVAHLVSMERLVGGKIK